MPAGMSLNIVSKRIGSTGRGTLVLGFEVLADFRSAVAYLSGDVVLFDATLQAQYLTMNGAPPSAPVRFPTEVAFPVKTIERPLNAPVCRMVFGNNFLNGSIWVDVIEFDPPTEDGADGYVVLECDTAEDYREVRRFVDEPHGSALKSGDGGLWPVHRVRDDGQIRAPFPQAVRIDLEWLYLT